MAESSSDWWQRGVVYQIYPLSFQDSNGDGRGDLGGIRARLSYLAELGVDAVWISPIYPSPMADMGYDVADYCDIDPQFGTLADFDALVAEAHALGLKVILDYVPNHTSSAHPWFRESRRSRTSAKRDWYLWKDPAPSGGPPNNWVSEFGGSAWEWEQASGQYYYHAFLKEQPDLNWRNRAVRDAMYEVLRFWMRRGVDGFRVDVLWHLLKDPQWRDNPPNPGWQPGDAGSRRLLAQYSADQPGILQVVNELRRVVDEFPERILIGELYLPLERLVAYYGGAEERGVHLPFNFQLLQTAWNAREIGRIVAEYERLVPEGEWPNWVLGNHDRPRVATRVGEAQAAVAAMLLLTLRGTPTLYYGDELGMRDVEIAVERLQDAREKNEPGLGLGRDPVRTPMQWDASRNAGFTTGEPWLPLAPDFGERNVAAQISDPRSLLSLYRRLLALRRRHAALSVGRKTLLASPEPVLAYERHHGDERFLIALNLGDSSQTMGVGTRGRIVLSTALDREEDFGTTLVLRPNEGVLARLATTSP